MMRSQIVTVCDELKAMKENNLIPAERIKRRILLLRGQNVMLDFQLAELYEVQTKALNQAVKRNIERFPADFIFQLSAAESEEVLRSQIVTLDTGIRSQIVTASKRNARFLPYAFTEQGVAMLSSVLHSPRAVLVNIAIMRAFVQLRQMLGTNADLARKLKALEGKYDAQFRVVFDAIRKLMEGNKPAQKRRCEIGFHTVVTRTEAAKK